MTGNERVIKGYGDETQVMGIRTQEKVNEWEE